MIHVRLPLACTLLCVVTSLAFAQQAPNKPTRLMVLGVDVELGMKWADTIAAFAEVSPRLDIYPSKDKTSLMVSTKDGGQVGSVRFKDGVVSDISNLVHSASGPENETAGTVGTFDALFQLLLKIERESGQHLAGIDLHTFTDVPEAVRWSIKIQFPNGRSVEVAMTKHDNGANRNFKSVSIFEDLSK